MIEVMYKGCIQGSFKTLEEIKKYYKVEDDQMIVLDGLVIIKAF